MITEPIALDKSLNTTDTNPKNITDVLQKGLNDIKNAIGGGGGGGGHTIIDSEGESLPQEPNMTFKDAHVTDNPTDESTDVEIVKSVASADYSSETEDGMYLIPDGEGAVIGPASDDKVEVTADGVKTWQQLLNELYAKIDFTKLTDNSVFDMVTTSHNYHQLELNSDSLVRFTMSRTNSDNSISSYTAWISSSGSAYNTTSGQYASQIVTNGYKFIIYYGNKKATVDLQTTANRCWYDSNKTVKQKIDESSNVVSLGGGISYTLVGKVLTLVFSVAQITDNMTIALPNSLVANCVILALRDESVGGVSFVTMNGGGQIVSAAGASNFTSGHNYSGSISCLVQ